VIDLVACTIKQNIPGLLNQVYSNLRARFKFQDWWPGESKDEIIIGAILTQNTSWGNVEKALGNLRSKGCLSLEKISFTDLVELEDMIQSSGFFRQKAKRLKSIAHLSRIPGNCIETLKRGNGTAQENRTKLLKIKGIGFETADSILLYAGDYPIFVIDAYTFRIFERAGLYNGKRDYSVLQSFISNNVDRDIGFFKDFHAQLVMLGKNYCRKKKPLCSECPIKEDCITGKKEFDRNGKGQH